MPVIFESAAEHDTGLKRARALLFLRRGVLLARRDHGLALVLALAALAAHEAHLLRLLLLALLLLLLRLLRLLLFLLLRLLRLLRLLGLRLLRGLLGRLLLLRRRRLRAGQALGDGLLHHGRLSRHEGKLLGEDHCQQAECVTLEPSSSPPSPACGP